VTFFMLMLSILNIFLAKLSGQEDIIVGTPIVGRRHADLEGIIGIFVNTLPLRNFPCADKTFMEFVSEVKERTLTTFENQDYPFEHLVENVLTKRETNRHPLFDVMFVMHNQEGEPEVSDVKERRAAVLRMNAECDILFRVEESNNPVIRLFYKETLFKAETIKKFIEYFNKIAFTLINNKNIKIEDIGILDNFFEEKLSVPRESGDFSF